MLNLIGDYENQLKQTALIDRLTGLYNRHYMVGRLESAVKENGPHSVAMIDIDDFKKINDRYGHNAGDYVLVNVARILKNICRDCKVSRWGGEEFLILASSASGSMSLTRISTRAKRPARTRSSTDPRYIPCDIICSKFHGVICHGQKS